MNYNPPGALSWDGWTDFRAEFRKKAPIRYWINQVVDRCSQIRNPFIDLREAILYRTSRRFHIVDTGLEPGYHDVDERMLHACFQLLVEYVEIECAQAHIVFHKERWNEYWGWKRRLPRFIRGRVCSRELGLAHLDWEISLIGIGGDPDDPGKTGQARRARTVKDLYLWWTVERPNREDPPTHPRENMDTWDIFSDRWKQQNPEKSKEIMRWADESHRLDALRDAEDLGKLVELMTIRKRLWT